MKASLNSQLTTSSVTVEVETSPDNYEEIDISVEVSYRWDNDGIGHYEFWGFPGYDKGIDFVEVESVTPKLPDEEFKPEVKAKILDYFNVHTKEIWSKLADEIQSNTEDCGDPDPEDFE